MATTATGAPGMPNEPTGRDGASDANQPAPRVPFPSSINANLQVFDKATRRWIPFSVDSTGGTGIQINSTNAASFKDSEGNPANVATSPATGTSAYAARRDHVHTIAAATVTDAMTTGVHILAAGTRAFTGDQSMGTHKLTNVVDPTANQDAATKNYVDNKSFNDQVASYTLVLGDNNKVVTMSNAGAITLSIPTNASVAFPVGANITVVQEGAGATDIVAVTPGTTTIKSTGATAANPVLRARYSSCTLLKHATDVWYVLGDIS